MGEETSNKKTEPSNLSNMVISIGKRKGESYGPALSLQDVFSESENSPGFHQKTSCPFVIEQGIWRNLKGKYVKIKLPNS